MQFVFKQSIQCQKNLNLIQQKLSKEKNFENLLTEFFRQDINNMLKHAAFYSLGIGGSVEILRNMINMNNKSSQHRFCQQQSALVLS